MLKKATRYAFRARMDKKVATGPIFASARDSTITDVTGKKFLDFNSGQMCSALGHNHPTVVAAVRAACDTMLMPIPAIKSSTRSSRRPRGSKRTGAGTAAEEPVRRIRFRCQRMAMMHAARKFTGGYEIASPHISFHGLSDATRAVTRFAGWHAGHGHLPGGTNAMAGAETATVVRWRRALRNAATPVSLPALRRWMPNPPAGPRQ